MATWFWLNIPLALLFVCCWAGIPLWLTLTRWNAELRAKPAGGTALARLRQPSRSWPWPRRPGEKPATRHTPERPARQAADHIGLEPAQPGPGEARDHLRRPGATATGQLHQPRQEQGSARTLNLP